MSTPSFASLAVVAAVAFVVPLALTCVPRLPIPSLVVELIAGIVIGPQVLGWAEADTAVQIMALLGVAFLLFIAGLEIDFSTLRGQTLKITGSAWLVSAGLAVGIGYALSAGGLVSAPLLVGIVLAATGLGVIIPILKDAGTLSTPFGRIVVAAASIAEIGTIVLLSLFFGESTGGLGSRFLLFGGFVLLVVAVALVIVGAEHVRRIHDALFRLMDTTAQIRVRGALLLLAVFVVAASWLGLEAILGAFVAGAILKLTDRDGMMTHSGFRTKLEAVGFGVFIPFFWVASGLRFDVDALFSGGSTLAMVPIFLGALLVARGLPTLAYRKLLPKRQLPPAGLLLATSISFIVVATNIGVELGTISEATAAAFVAAGLLSVILFPLGSLVLLGRADPAARATAERPARHRTSRPLGRSTSHVPPNSTTS